VTVIPGDAVLADEEAVLFFPPQLADKVIEQVKTYVEREDYERDLARQKKHRFRDVYPMSPELQKQFEETRKKK
jgi:regulator of RNase E activity RraA